MTPSGSEPLHCGDVEIVGDYTYVRRIWHGVYRLAGPDKAGRIVSQLQIRPVDALAALGYRDTASRRRRMEADLRHAMRSWTDVGWRIETVWPEDLTTS